jgi:hypothetical protein
MELDSKSGLSCIMVVIDLPIAPPTLDQRKTSSVKNGLHLLFILCKHIRLAPIMIIMDFEHIFL